MSLILPNNQSNGKRLQPINFPALIKKYQSHRLPDVRDDVGNLLVYAQVLSVENQRLRHELQGATDTMKALCRAIGSVDVPHALVASLDPGDQLHVEDVPLDTGMVKRFNFVAAPQNSTEDLTSKSSLG